MKINVIGKMKYDFVDQTTGKQVVGTNIYYTVPIRSTYGVGSKGMKKSVKPDVLKFEDIPVGSVDFDVDLDGNILGINK